MILNFDGYCYYDSLSLIQCCCFRIYADIDCTFKEICVFTPLPVCTYCINLYRHDLEILYIVVGNYWDNPMYLVPIQFFGMDSPEKHWRACTSSAICFKSFLNLFLVTFGFVSKSYFPEKDEYYLRIILFSCIHIIWLLYFRYWNDKDVLQKLGEAMGLVVPGDADTSAETSGLDETDEVENED